MRRALLVCRVVLFAVLIATPAALPAAEPESAERIVKHWIRATVTRDEDRARYGLELGARGAARLKTRREAPLVVLLHGYNSNAAHGAAFAAALRESGLPCAAFVYPNDQPLGESAKLLSRELKRLRKKLPRREVALVAHSMGGLVARACVENPALAPGNVARLVMIAPPNHGTLLARFAVGTDLCEHFLKWKGGGPIDRVRAAIVDGLGEATEDLEPESAFLTRLNARERNPRVKYTILLGTGGKVQRWELDLARRAVRYCGKIPFMDEPVDKLDRLLADLDEIVRGAGDGVVAVKRGKLKGVADTVILPFAHLTVMGPDGGPRVQSEVLKRLLGEKTEVGKRKAAPAR